MSIFFTSAGPRAVLRPLKQSIARGTNRNVSSPTRNTAQLPTSVARQWHKTSRTGRRALYIAGGASVLGLGLILKRPPVDAAEDETSDKRQLSTVPLRKLLTGWMFVPSSHSREARDANMVFRSAFAFCSSPTWVDISESVYKVTSHIPIVSSLAHLVVTNIFVEQFLGGQTLEETIPKMIDLRDRQIGTLLGYNIEAELDGSSKDPALIQEQVHHVLESIDAQGELGRKFVPAGGRPVEDSRCWVRIKLTGLIPHPLALRHASEAIIKTRRSRGLGNDVPLPGLPGDGDWQAALSAEAVSDRDREQLKTLWSTLETIATRARQNHVRVVVDAEQSWYQPVIDVMTDELMQRYNTLDGPATIIASFQAYLRRHPHLVRQQVARAEEKGYKLMFKQVRGAYMDSEAARAVAANCPEDSPVWQTKTETDASFNDAMRYTLEKVAEQVAAGQPPRNSAVFATHNSHSVDEAIRLLKEYNLVDGVDSEGRSVLRPDVASSIAFAQIYGRQTRISVPSALLIALRCDLGMKDDLTNRVTGTLTSNGRGPLVVKVSLPKRSQQLPQSLHPGSDGAQSMSYGELKECLPFLARRAVENKSVLEGRGGAVAERSRLGREIGRRLLPWRS